MENEPVGNGVRILAAAQEMYDRLQLLAFLMENEKYTAELRVLLAKRIIEETLSYADGVMERKRGEVEND